MSLGAKHWLAALAIVGLAACAAPSRRLSLRQVEDPIVLPRRMASTEVVPYVYLYQPTGLRRADITVPGFRLGLTDRLEWVNLLSLRYAFLDDSPGSPRPGAPLSLAVRAGATGFGFSSFQGAIVLPVLSIDVWKHVADRWLLAWSLDWSAYWSSRTVQFINPYDGTLFPARNRWSAIDVSIGVTRQLADRIALGVWAGVGQNHSCADSLCPWSSREGRAGLRLSLRLWHWMTVGLVPSVGGRFRPLVIAPPQDPNAPVDPPPRSVTWVGASAFVTFYW